MLPVKKEKDIPSLEEVRGLFEGWRKEKKGRDPIPTELWEAAAALAGRHSIHEIARHLRLNHNTLKARVEARGGDATAFIDIGPLMATIEMTKPSGEKMKITGNCNVTELVRVFLA